MKKYDFLTEFENELERDAEVSHKLEGEERDIFLAMMEVVEEKNERSRRFITTMQNPESKRQFDELTPLLIHLAIENCACLRIFDEDEAVIRVELEFLNLMGGRDEHAIHGEILAKIFNLYRDFSLEMTLNDHMILKFNVPLVDEVIITGGS